MASGRSRAQASTLSTGLLVLVLVWLLWIPFAVRGHAHGFGSQITWNREISRLLYAHCASCHRPGGGAFSLMRYADAQPRANEIKDAVLARRMPPWGAVKGFGHFRNDQSLMQEQIELITRWVDGGIRRGNNPQMLPKEPEFKPVQPEAVSPHTIAVQGVFTLPSDTVVDGVLPERIPAGGSMRIFAVLPGGSVQPLVWLHEYDTRYAHPFLFRQPLRLPSGTVIQGVPAEARVALIPKSQ